MNKSKLHRLLDLINDIKKIDALIQLHSGLDDSDEITNQYVSKKEKLVGYIIDELNDPKNRSQDSFLIIKLLIEKFYTSDKNITLRKAFTKQDFPELEKAL